MIVVYTCLFDLALIRGVFAGELPTLLVGHSIVESANVLAHIRVREYPTLYSSACVDHSHAQTT